MNRRVGTLLLVFMMMSVFLNPSPVEPGFGSSKPSYRTEESPENPGPSDRQQQTSCEIVLQSICSAVEDFFGTRETADPDVLNHLGVPLDDRGRIGFMIVLAADPVHSHQSLFFDRTIEAAEQGFQQQSYIFVRATLPWDDQQHPESTDYKLRLGQKDYERQQGSRPGLMIFRRRLTPNDKSQMPKILFVFVVGETPTGGIQREQFLTALTAVRKMGIAQGPFGDQADMPILGPTYSGSLYSLHDILNDPHSGMASANLLVHSGTVSSSATIEWFQSTESQDHPNTRFRTFQEGDQYALAQFVCFVKRLGYEARDVAILSEGETAYGASWISPGPLQSATGAPYQGPCGRPWKEERTAMLRLYFPRDISQLRSAYQQSVLLTEAGGDKGLLPPTTLPLNLEDTGSDEDSVPVYAHRQSPLSQESVLLGIVTSLKKHFIRFVVIQASNPVDQLFLCRFLRRVYPEVRIVTSGADLLFQREKRDALFHGILAITAYPLLPAANDYAAVSRMHSKDEHAELTFPSTFSTGVFNATVSLLNCPRNFRKGADNFQDNDHCMDAASQSNPLQAPDAPYAEFGWPAHLGNTHDTAAQHLAPPLWLTVLGRDGYWGVALLSGDNYARPAWDARSNIPTVDGIPYPKESAKLVAVHGTEDWRYLVLVMLAVSIIFSACCWYGPPNSVSEAFSGFAILQDAHRTHILVVAAVLILTGLAILIWPWHWFSETFGFDWAPWAVVIWIPIFALLFAANLSIRKAKYGLIVFSISVVLMTFAFSRMVFMWEPARDYLLAYRSYHLTSGVSPLVPGYLLLAAGLWWAWYSLSGLTLLDSRRPLLPALRAVSADQGLSRSCELYGLANDLSDAGNTHLVNLLKSPFAGRWVVLRIAVPSALVIGAYLALHRLRPVNSLEGQLFDKIYALFFGLVAYTLFCDLLRMLAGWWQFRRLLVGLNRLPLRRGFQRLKGVGWRPGVDIYRALFRERDSLARYFNTRKLRESEDRPSPEADVIKKLGDPAWRSLEANIAAYFGPRTNLPVDQTSGSTPPQEARQSIIRTAFALILAWGVSRQTQASELQEALSRVHGLISQTSACVLAWLVSQWDKEPKQKPESKPRKYRPPDESDSEESDPPVEVKSAETFVCFVYLSFIDRVTYRMRLLAYTIGGMYVLLLLSISSYPFEPHSGVRALMGLLLVVILAVVSYVFARMYRDVTLSRISDSKPGELGLEFWLRIAGFAALPLLSLIASQFPELNETLFSWLRPLLSNFRQ